MNNRLIDIIIVIFVFCSGLYVGKQTVIEPNDVVNGIPRIGKEFYKCKVIK